MTVRVPFQLRRLATAQPAPASAVFVPGRDAATLLEVCTRLGADPSGAVHDVAGGFLLRLAATSSEPLPGAIRLREPSTDLFVPADAELVPSLLDDEAAGMVRDGGIVFLPGGTALRFDRTAPMGLASLLTASPRPRRDWSPMPEPPALAARVVEVSREWPEPPADELYRELEQDVRGRGSSKTGSGPGENPGAGGEAVGGGSDAEGLGGNRADGLMSGLHDLGRALRRLAGRTGSGARSLGEKVRWGMLDHSGLIRKLLREFQQGDANRALRHALSIAPTDPRDRRVGGGARLPFSRAIYSLMDLLRTSSRGGTVGIWQVRPDLLEELRREYRRAAETAIRQGDFRRAAYIYGKLLGDDRLAAQALRRGGLHRDAAILYLKKLNDRAAAAQAFEAAGLVDRAIALYRELGRHEAAGDLLRRLGDEAGAVGAYRLAASNACETRPPGWFEAGRILLKAGLMDAGVAAFRKGWDTRPDANATACALEVVTIHAARGEIAPLRELLDEADACFRSVGSPGDAGALYNRIATAAANTPALSPFAEDAHDRARTAMADQLRRQIEVGRPPAAAVSALFGVPSLWTSSFVRDAQYAAAASADRARDRGVPADRHAPWPGIQVGRSAVTAACQATTDGELFLGFADGKVFAFRPRRNQVIAVGEGPGTVVDVATDVDGQVVVVLWMSEFGSVRATFLRQADGWFLRQPDSILPPLLRTVLTPVVTIGSSSLVGLGQGSEFLILEATSGLTHARIALESADDLPTTALLLPHRETFRILTHHGPRWWLCDDQVHPLHGQILAWQPVGSGRPTRCSVPLGATYLDGHFKVVGLDELGAVHASLLWTDDGEFELLSSAVAMTDGGYLATAQTGPNKVVAVAAGRIDWLSEGSDRFRTTDSIADVSLARTVACFASSSADEVLVVAAEGLVSRITVPRRGRRRPPTT